MPYPNERIRNIITSQFTVPRYSETGVIIREQLDYIKSEEDCKKIFLLIYINNIPYGGVFFFSSDLTSYTLIQAIVKYPDAPANDIKLNSVVDEPLPEIAQYFYVEYVYVKPIGKQGLILKKHYGYKIAEKDVENPCKSIATSLGRNQEILYNKIK